MPMEKRQRLLGLLAAGAVLLGGIGPSPADETPANLGKQVPTFTLSDPRDQARFTLDDCKDKKAIVIVFLGTECPINNAYLPRLAELHKEYAGKGAQFIGINANRTDSAERVAEHAKKHQVPFPVLKDPDNAVADRLGVRRTPEALLLDGGGRLRYQGRI